MAKYGVIGAGLMGRVAVDDLLKSQADASVVLGDRSETLLDEVARRVDDPRLATRVVDVVDRQGAANAFASCDVVIAALPHRLSLYAVEAAIAAGTSLVDLVGSSPERRQALDADAVRARCLVVPGCGVAPGISNFCVGHAMSQLEETDRVAIYVGGIPRRPKPPLFYETVYLLESVLSAYRRPVTIQRDGRAVRVEALSGLETLEFPEPIGQLEAFYTDGLASLPLTIGSRVRRDLYEKTLRHPGHVTGIQFLQACGLLSTDPVVVGNTEVPPVSVLQKVLEDKLVLGPEGDILALRVMVEGRADGQPTTHTFELIDGYDSSRGHTAMGRTTCFTAAIAARQIASGSISEVGVRFPEQIFIGDRFDSMVAALRDRGVRVAHRCTSPAAR